MRRPETIPDAIQQLKYIANAYFTGIYPKDHQPKMEEGGDYDPEFKDESDLHLLIDGWITITPFHTTEQYKCIGTERTRDVIGFSFETVSVVSGGRMEPDSVDLDEVELPEPINHPINAIEFACKMLFNNELNQVAENFSVDEQFKEEALEESEIYV